MSNGGRYSQNRLPAVEFGERNVFRKLLIALGGREVSLGVLTIVVLLFRFSRRLLGEAIRSERNLLVLRSLRVE